MWRSFQIHFEFMDGSEIKYSTGNIGEDVNIRDDEACLLLKKSLVYIWHTSFSKSADGYVSKRFHPTRSRMLYRRSKMKASLFPKVLDI